MYKKTLSSMCIVISIAISGCGSSGSKTVEEPQQPPPAADEYIGYWQQAGYGKYLEISVDQVIQYEASNDTCIQTHSVVRGEFPSEFNWTIKSFTDQQFLASENNASTSELTLDRVNALPLSCNNLLTNTPSNVVTHLIAMASENYAFFELRNINWQEASEQALARVNDDMTEEQLKSVLHELMSVFNDKHVLLHSKPLDFFEPEISIDDITFFGQSNDFTNQVISEYEELSSESSLEDYYYSQIITYYTNINNIMDSGLKAKGGQDEDKIMWGTIGNNIGYLHIGELDNFDPSQPYTLDEGNVVAHLAALNAVLDEAITDLQNTNGIILDIRMHSGGTTSLDRAVAQRFIEQEINYGSFAVINEEPKPLILTPYDGIRLAQQTVLITSNFVQSSGEDMVIALKADDDILQVGEATLGTLSDMLFLSLPNQWAFTLSNQVWLDKNGKSWESIGITPEHEVDVFPLSDRQQEIDSAINKALELLN